MNKIFEKFQNFNTHQEVASVLIQLFITGVVTMVSSYVYQLFSWKFDNFYGVLMAFVIVVFIFSGIILFLFNILKRNKLSGHSEKKIPLLKAPFVYASIGIIAVLIAFLFTIIDFFKYVNVLSSDSRFKKKHNLKLFQQRKIKDNVLCNKPVNDVH